MGNILLWLRLDYMLFSTICGPSCDLLLDPFRCFRIWFFLIHGHAMVFKIISMTYKNSPLSVAW